MNLSIHLFRDILLSRFLVKILDKAALAEWIKSERRAGVTQKEIATALKVDPSTISYWSRQRSDSINYVSAKAIADYRNISFEEVVAWLKLDGHAAMHEPSPRVSETPGSYRISDRFRMPTKSELHDSNLNIAEAVDLMKQLSDLQAELVVALRHKIESQGIPTNEEFPISPTICCVKKLLVEQLGGWRGIMKQAIDFAKRSTSDYKGDADRWIELFEGRGDPDDDDLLCIIVTLTLLFSGNDFMKEELSKCHQYRLMESCLPQKNRAENPAISRT